VGGHLHAYEESFFILSGEVTFRMGGRDALLRSGDFGVVPLGVPHAWKNVADEPARWLRIRVPQPRDTEDELTGTYAVPGFALPENASPPPFGLPSVRHLGHYGEEQLPPPGPVSIRGTNNYAVRNIGLRLMVDSTLGAYHHTAFVGQMASDPARTGDVPPPHYHAFEEMYYFISGTARGLLEGDEHPISAGDVAFAGVNATHGFTPTGYEPLRWIVVMAPVPPEQDSMMFVNQWKALDDAMREGRW
jgi:mannose-6-phosphate isomerase-like protein (cupin superfamily)